MLQKINTQIEGCNNKPIVIDATFQNNNKLKPVVVFCHGFKGFKDWGPFNAIADYFAEKGFLFLKFNFSYNGTTPGSLINFNDLKAFGQNNFCKELDDLSIVLDWLQNTDKLITHIDKDNISLLGHSRGGAIAMLKTSENNNINKLVSWASPADLLRNLPEGKKLDNWKKKDVIYIYNGRTKQNMPLYFQFYQNCKQNTSRLSIEKSVRNLTIPQLIVHGSDDTTVLLREARLINSWNVNSKLYIVKRANHVFGGYHPFKFNKLPDHLKEVLDVTINFLKN